MNVFFLSSEPVDQLRNELDQVTTERDRLVAQVKADADQLEAIVASVHLQGTSRCGGASTVKGGLVVRAQDRRRRGPGFKSW